MFVKVYGDSMEDLQLGFQDPASPIGEGIIEFHHDLMILLTFVVCFVSYMLFRVVSNFNSTSNEVADGVVHGTLIEIIWTCVPALALMVLAIPSFALLYSVDEVVDPSLTLKVVGHQWYWSYEYNDLGSVEFDSYMVAEDDLNVGELRLLEVDNRVILPVDTHVRLIVTAGDVIHSWAVPSLGIKIDACPGRLNQISVLLKRPGVYYGQCSEICGVNHAFMPIAVEGVSMEEYLNWLSENVE